MQPADHQPRQGRRLVSAYGQDPAGSVFAFQVSVGLAGTTNKTVKLPTNFTPIGPWPGCTCGPALERWCRRCNPGPDCRCWTQADSHLHLLPAACVALPDLLRLLRLLLYNNTIVSCACACDHDGHRGNGGGGRNARGGIGGHSAGAATRTAAAS